MVSPAANRGQVQPPVALGARHLHVDQVRQRVLDCDRNVGNVLLYQPDRSDQYREADGRDEQHPHDAGGARPTSLIQTGIYDNSEIYDATYANCNQWGDARWASPSVIIEGKLVTTKLTDINIGMEEFVEHSFYDDWTKTGPQRYRTDALGNPLSPYHAWNKTTLPKPAGTNFKDKYTWSTAPRWDRQVVETGAYGQLWGTALRGDYAENPFCNPTGDGLQLVLPRFALPETELFWPLPRTLNALERNRARA